MLLSLLGLPPAFLILSFITILCALYVVTNSNPVYSVLALILTFFSISAHYVLLNAQFLAVVNLIVYAGAIMVLFLFVLMLLNLNKENEPTIKTGWYVAAAISAGLLLLILAAALHRSSESIMQNSAAEIGLVKNLGKVLFTEYLVPFELSGILFLAAMVGAVLLGKKQSTEVNSKSDTEPSEK
ncbi:MAG: NADH-quinone oxidoreductase subunit J [Bacteroidetes bacterium]|nr:NADH-quinone oxidoreductase subunit J [Bacteroidota bacterium]